MNRANSQVLRFATRHADRAKHRCVFQEIKSTGERGINTLRSCTALPAAGAAAAVLQLCCTYLCVCNSDRCIPFCVYFECFRLHPATIKQCGLIPMTANTPTMHVGKVYQANSHRSFQTSTVAQNGASQEGNMSCSALFGATAAAAAAAAAVGDAR